MKYPVIYVVWKDHAKANTGAWANVDELHKNKLVTGSSVGYLVFEDEDAIQISTTYVDEYEIVGDPEVIGKKMIVYRTELDVKEWKPPKRRTRKAAS